MLGACGSKGEFVATQRKLPDPPQYLEPTPLPVVKKNEPLVLVAKVRGNIIKRQNEIITRAKSDWKGMQEIYATSPKERGLFGF